GDARIVMLRAVVVSGHKCPLETGLHGRRRGHSYRRFLAGNHLPDSARSGQFSGKFTGRVLTLPRHIGTWINMTKIRKICVYCGSGPGTDPAFVAAARAFGKILAQNNIGLVYGGGSVGMMGDLADSVLKNGGEAIGIIPDFLLNREHPRRGVEGLVLTKDLHERKRKMFEMADAFVALPGGVGTLEELIEQLTWVQLGRHRKPVLIANIKGFWN